MDPSTCELVPLVCIFSKFKNSILFFSFKYCHIFSSQNEAFGVGSMIYSGLEFAQYFEESSNPKCHNVMMAITPAARMFFTFFQMYFIFLNSKVI